MYNKEKDEKFMNQQQSMQQSYDKGSKRSTIELS